MYKYCSVSLMLITLFQKVLYASILALLQAIFLRNKKNTSDVIQHSFVNTIILKNSLKN